MNNMSTAELLGMMGEALQELERRFQLQKKKPAPDLSLFKDGDRMYYSVCGYPFECSCRYHIMPKSRSAQSDRRTRPNMDDRALYLYGDTTQAKLEELCGDALTIKVVRNYAFLTFATHVQATEAQCTLQDAGFSVTFNRIK
jgi:hypothetical protein